MEWLVLIGRGTEWFRIVEMASRLGINGGKTAGIRLQCFPRVAAHVYYA
jgi:hypothetical protein